MREEGKRLAAEQLAATDPRGGAGASIDLEPGMREDDCSVICRAAELATVSQPSAPGASILEVNALEESIRKTYFAGYAAFDLGDFSKAVSLASQCLEAATPESYWHFGALGLRCWAANYLADDASVERDARALLSEDSGADKPWFDGLALFNLALVARRAGLMADAKSFFAQASRSYAAYKVGPEQQESRELVNQFFVTVTDWASTGDSSALRNLARECESLTEPDEEARHLLHATQLYLRRSEGEDTREHAAAAAKKRVSRAFLALLLLEEKDTR